MLNGGQWPVNVNYVDQLYYARDQVEESTKFSKDCMSVLLDDTHVAFLNDPKPRLQSRSSEKPP